MPDSQVPPNSRHDYSPPLLPTYGPEYWALRRAEWLNPSSPPNKHTANHSARGDEHKRLVELMKSPGAEESIEIWRSGVDKVWKSLVSGAIQKAPIPLPTAVRILRAGWLRDGTWPAGVVAPSSSEGEAIPPILSTTPAFASQPTSELHTPRSDSASDLLARFK